MSEATSLLEEIDASIAREQERKDAALKMGDGLKLKKTFWGNSRIDFTFSLADKKASSKALQAAIEAVETMGSGWTHREGLGGWRGETEYSHTLSIVGNEFAESHALHYVVICALTKAGCESIQVETWRGQSYRCEEWQAS